MNRFVWRVLGVGAAIGLMCQVALAQDELPTGEEVLARFVEVTGGKEAYGKIKTQEVVAKLTLPREEIQGDLSLQLKKGVGLVMTIDLGRLGKTRMGLSGEVGWEESLLQGARRLSKQETSMLLQSTDPESAVHWKRYFTSATNEGIEEIDDQRCYRVVLKTSRDLEQVDFYSVESGLLVASKVQQPTMLGPIEIVVHQSDYRDVDGLKMAFKSEQVSPSGTSQVVEITRMTLNADLEDSLFALPVAVAGGER